MKQRNTILAVVAAVLLLPALLTACSREPDPDGASGGANATDNGAKTAACMREKGYDMDDPKNGAQTLSAPEGVDQDQWMRDLGTCSGAAKGGAGDGAQQAKPFPGAAEKQKKVAACMRENGFDDYPDDMDSQAKYTPSGDTDSFESTAKQCDEKVWGDVGGQEVSQ